MPPDTPPSGVRVVGAGGVTEQQPVHRPADHLVGLDALHAHALHRLGGHGPGRLPDDLREVDAVDHLIGEPDEVHLGEHGVHHRLEVDALQHGRGQVEPVEDRLDVQALRDGVEVEAFGDGVDVDTAYHRVDVDSAYDLVDQLVEEPVEGAGG